MMASGEKLTQPQERGIDALLTCRTLAEAAAKAGVSERSLRNWLKRPAFQAAYRSARRQIIEQAVTQLQRSADAAVKALQRNLKCGQPGNEIKAAVAVLDHSMKGVELLELEERLAALEAAAERK